MRRLGGVGRGGMVDPPIALDEHLGRLLSAAEEPMTVTPIHARSAVRPIPVNTPLLNGRERELLIECIETGWISSEGPFVSRFEEEFSRRMGRKYGIAVANGSA